MYDNNNTSEDDDDCDVGMGITNDDWGTTCAIYYDNETIQSKKSIGIIDITVSTTNVTFARRISPNDDFKEPAFQYWSLDDNGKESPVVRLRFHYNNKKKKDNKNNKNDVDDEINGLAAPPNDVHVSFVYFPPDNTEAFPPGIKRDYLSWLTTRCNEILLESKTSYSVCEFVAHDSLTQFFTIHHEDPCNGYTMLMLKPQIVNGIIYSGAVRGDIIWPLSNDVIEWYKEEKKSEQQVAMSLETYAKVTIIDTWKTQFEMDCPICFDTVQFSDGIVLPTCNHLFCVDCFKMYLHVKVTEISQYKTNPFQCPVLKCNKRDIPVIGFVKQHLSNDDMNVVYDWYKDLKQPPCWSLTSCLSPKCNKEGTMRRPNMGSNTNKIRNHYVFCDECNVTWCELCLKKVGRNNSTSNRQKTKKLVGQLEESQQQLLQDHDEKCNPNLAIQFTQRYLAANDTIKLQVEEKFPWIKIYANSHAHDKVSEEWILHNGQICPNCKTGIERSEGCFHMKCITCNTHFCYECGDEIFPPYYGTHHCWENAIRNNTTF